MAAALSFLPVQLCVWLEVTAFFLRHQTPTDKSRVVPGLHELLNQVTIIRTRTHRLGRLGGFALQGSNNGGGSSGRFANRRRSSRASKDLSGMLSGLNGEPIVQRVSSFQHLFV
uniref:Secreted protein n=1 Tax=Meloidogyne hapla TaxID=6305 RepID=A0A1I8BLT7_MELHA